MSDFHLQRLIPSSITEIRETLSIDPALIFLICTDHLIPCTWQRVPPLSAVVCMLCTLWKNHSLVDYTNREEIIDHLLIFSSLHMIAFIVTLLSNQPLASLNSYVHTLMASPNLLFIPI